MSSLEIILGIISILGTIGTFYFGHKAEKMAKEKQRFSWADVEDGCRALNRKALKRYKPDLIVCFSGPSSIIANLMIQLSDYFVSVYVSILQKSGTGRRDQFSLDNYQTIVTSKWRLHIPSEVFADTSKKVLLVDDCVISGDSLALLKKTLLDNGFSNDKVRSCCLICSNIAKETNKAPNYYQYLLENSVFYLPWGKGY